MKVADLFARLAIRPDKKTFTQADRMLGAVKKALVGIVAFKTVKWFAGLINETRDTADQFNKMAKQVGISSEALQQLEFAAQLGGTNLNVLRTGLQRFARNAKDATRGIKASQEGFQELGISVKDSHGNLRQVDDLLMDVADSFQAMPDGTTKTALAMQTFGRAGAQMIPMLNEGSAGIGKLRKEFIELGAQIDTETGQQFETLNDDILRVKVAFEGLKHKVVIALLPLMLKLAKAAVIWMKANKQLLKQRVVAFAKGLIFVFRMLGKVIGFVIGKWRELTVIISSILITKYIWLAVAAFTAFKKAATLAGLAAVKAWILTLAPFILVAVAIAALILIVQSLWIWFKGGESVIGKLHGWLVDKMVGAFEAVAESIKGVLYLWDKFKRATGLERFTSKLAGVETRTPAEQLRAQAKTAARGRRWAKVRGEDPKQFADPEALRRRAALLESRERRPTRIIPTIAPNRMQVSNTITVNARTGADAKEISAEITKVQESFWSGMMRQAIAATGQ